MLEFQDFFPATHISHVERAHTSKSGPLRYLQSEVENLQRRSLRISGHSIRTLQPNIRQIVGIVRIRVRVMKTQSQLRYWNCVTNTSGQSKRIELR